MNENKLADEWNAKYPPGTPVTILGGYVGVTWGPAIVGCGVAKLRVDGHIVNLRDITPNARISDAPGETSR